MTRRRVGASEGPAALANPNYGRFGLGRRVWPVRKFNRNLNLRACAGLETPLRIRFKSSAIELLVSGALQHSRPGNSAGLLINRYQNNAFPGKPLFCPFRAINRMGCVDSSWGSNGLRFGVNRGSFR